VCRVFVPTDFGTGDPVLSGITSEKLAGPLSVCLSVRLLKKLRTDFDDIVGGVGRRPRTK